MILSPDLWQVENTRLTSAACLLPTIRTVQCVQRLFWRNLLVGIIAIKKCRFKFRFSSRITFHEFCINSQVITKDYFAMKYHLKNGGRAEKIKSSFHVPFFS